MMTGNESNPYVPPLHVDHSPGSTRLPIGLVVAITGMSVYPLAFALCEILNLRHFPPEPMQFMFVSIGFAGLSILATRFLWLRVVVICLCGLLSVLFSLALLTGWQSRLGWDLVERVLQAAGIVAYGYGAVTLSRLSRSKRRHG